jgi:hypothetical protein
VFVARLILGSWRRDLQTMCECGAPEADGGVVGIYCTRGYNCPVEMHLVRNIRESIWTCKCNTCQRWRDERTHEGTTRESNG